MIDITNTVIAGFVPALRGMRNSFDSHNKSDTDFLCPEMFAYPISDSETDAAVILDSIDIGEADKKLCMKLIQAGEPHCKFRRMIQIWADINAPLFWWKQYDTYKVGTVANSESTMHNICDKEFKLEDFGIVPEYITSPELRTHWIDTIYILNCMRESYLEAKATNNNGQAALIQRYIYELLPNAYMQKRTVNLNYSVLAAMYKQRKHHKLHEWRAFCEWIEKLPYSEFITGRTKDDQC